MAAWTLLSIAWIALPTQAVLSALMVRKFLRLFDRSERELFASHHPRVAVVVPFKGVDEDMEANLRGLLTQDFPSYRLVFVVESESDAAYPMLRQAVDADPGRRAEIVVAGEAEGGAHTTGQKVHNLLAAVDVLRRGDDEVWAFADSDAAPGPWWLQSLVGPLVKSSIAVTTGYRWFVPPPGDGSFASAAASVMNSSIACFAARQRFILAWGGSMAMRRETAEAGGLVERWQGALSDDYQVTRMAREMGSRVYFVPRCLVPATASFTMRSLFEFGRRQYLITRVHARPIYWGGLAILTIYFASLAATVASIPLLWDDPRRLWLAPLAALAVACAADQARAHFRERVMRRAFDEETVRRLAPARRLERLATPIYMTLHWALMFSAVVGRTITWRGRAYVMRGRQRIERVG